MSDMLVTHSGSERLTTHDHDTPRLLRRCDEVQEGKTEVRGEVQTAPDTEHLQMREAPERWSESWIEVELVVQLEYAHQGDEE